MKYVVYKHGDEVIVGAKKDEPSIIREYFFHGSGRDIDDYDREVIDQPVCITARSLVE